MSVCLCVLCVCIVTGWPLDYRTRNKSEKSSERKKKHPSKYEVLFLKDIFLLLSGQVTMRRRRNKYRLGCGRRRRRKWWWWCSFGVGWRRPLRVDYRCDDNQLVWRAFLTSFITTSLCDSLHPLPFLASFGQGERENKKKFLFTFRRPIFFN